MVIYFSDPEEPDQKSVAELAQLCDKYNIPFASNVATAEMLILGLKRGDLDWREIVKSGK